MNRMGRIDDRLKGSPGPSCSNCGAGWYEEQVEGRDDCPGCGYPLDADSPLATGERHDVDDYVDLGELVEDDDDA